MNKYFYFVSFLFDWSIQVYAIRRFVDVANKVLQLSVPMLRLPAGREATRVGCCAGICIQLCPG